MNLGEQLKELRNNILRDKSDLIAGDSDSLWDDETLLSYIKDGERRFARRTLLLRDGNSGEFTTVQLREGERSYPLHKLVMSVVSARVTGQQQDMTRCGRCLVQEGNPRSTLDFSQIANNTATTGLPTAYYTDETMVYAHRGVITLEVFPIPDAAAAGTVLNLRVVRLPKGGYTRNDLDRESEIPEDYQLDCLQWAAHRAQANFDADAGEPGDANRHYTAFENAVTAAIKETKRRMLAITGLNYGQNGFTWER
jgi:hypothetical protein